MVQNQNSDTSKELIQAGKLQTAAQEVPRDIARSIVPTIECNPKLLRFTEVIRSNTCSDAANLTIMTPTSAKDFYITGVAIALSKDVLAQSTASVVSATVGGFSSPIMTFRYEPLTAESKYFYCEFTKPIKIDRGTSISLANSSAVPSIDVTVTIYGFYDDVGNA